jgi:hypothetical protein
VTIEIAGVTNYTTTAGNPVIHAFGDGTYTVRAAFSNDQFATNNAIQVRAVGSIFPYQPVCLFGKSRTWTCTNVPQDIVVEADPRLTFDLTRLSTNSVKMTFVSNTTEPQYLVYRLGGGGPILDAVPVKTLTMFSSDLQNLNIQQTYPDGRQLVSVTVWLGDMPPNVSMYFYIFGGGVTLDDGTLSRTVTASAFVGNGQYTYYLIRSADAPANFCHSTSLYQGGQSIGVSW